MKKSLAVLITILAIITTIYTTAFAEDSIPLDITDLVTDFFTGNQSSIMIQSSSMEPTLEIGDNIIIDCTAYEDENVNRGDIIFFRYPVALSLGTETYYVMRAIGLPGETVEITNAKIYIDGAGPLEENYLKEDWVIANNGYSFKVPAECYLVLADNRNLSSDSRYWAMQALQAYADADIEITDEEAWHLSFVPKKDILGKVIGIAELRLIE